MTPMRGEPHPVGGHIVPARIPFRGDGISVVIMRSACFCPRRLAQQAEDLALVTSKLTPFTASKLP